jgi:hypothetical protein
MILFRYVHTEELVLPLVFKIASKLRVKGYVLSQIHFVENTEFSSKLDAKLGHRLF